MSQQLPHNPVLVMDIFEGKMKGQDVEGELGKFLTVIRQNLVPMGLADYFWIGLDGTRHTLEHKTASELLNTMGGRLDIQLRKNTQNADDVGLIIDGIITPGDDGKSCYTWNASSNNPRIMVRGHRSPHSYQEVVGYLWRLDKEGITVYTAPDWKSMCRAIAEYVYNTLKEEHKTLRRYIKTRPIILDKGVPKATQRYIETLMGLSHARIGEKTARRILQEHGTPFNFFLSEVGANKAIGLGTFKAAMEAIGRNI